MSQKAEVIREPDETDAQFIRRATPVITSIGEAYGDPLNSRYASAEVQDLPDGWKRVILIVECKP